MKHLFKTYIIVFIHHFICCVPNAAAQTTENTNEKLNYLHQDGYAKAIKYAEKENKPVLVFFHSKDCHKCEDFSAEVLGSDTFTRVVKSKYVAINADIGNRDARKAAEGFSVRTLPFIVLLHPSNTKFYYICSMSMDIDTMLNQIDQFTTAKNIYDQIQLLSSTNNISIDSASAEIARNYARKDYTKYKDEAALHCTTRTLGIEFFSKFKDIYIKEWQIQEKKSQ